MSENVTVSDESLMHILDAAEVYYDRNPHDDVLKSSIDDVKRVRNNDEERTRTEATAGTLTTDPSTEEGRFLVSMLKSEGYTIEVDTIYEDGQINFIIKS